MLVAIRRFFAIIAELFSPPKVVFVFDSDTDGKWQKELGWKVSAKVATTMQEARELLASGKKADLIIVGVGVLGEMGPIAPLLTSPLVIDAKAEDPGRPVLAVADSGGFRIAMRDWGCDYVASKKGAPAKVREVLKLFWHWRCFW